MSFMCNSVITRYFKVTKGQIVPVEIHPLGSDTWYRECHTEEIHSILGGKLKEKLDAEALQRRRTRKRKERAVTRNVTKAGIMDRLVTVNGPTLRLAYAFKQRDPHSKHLLITRFGAKQQQTVCLDHSIEPEKLVVYVWLLEKYRRHLQGTEVKSSVSDYFSGGVSNPTEKQQTLKTMLEKGRRHKRKKSSCHNAESNISHKRRKSSLDLETFMLHSYGKTAGHKHLKNVEHSKTISDCVRKEEMEKLDGSNSEKVNMINERLAKQESELVAGSVVKGSESTEDLTFSRKNMKFREHIEGDVIGFVSERSGKEINNYTTCAEVKVSDQNGQSQYNKTDGILVKTKNSLSGNCKMRFSSGEESEGFYKKDRSSLRGNVVASFVCKEGGTVVDIEPPLDEFNDTVSKVCSEVFSSVHEEKRRSNVQINRTDERSRGGQMPMPCAVSTTTTYIAAEDLSAIKVPDPEIKLMSPLRTSAKTDDTDDLQNLKVKRVANLVYDFDSDDSDFLVRNRHVAKKKENCSKALSSKLRRKKGSSKTAKVLEDDEFGLCKKNREKNLATSSSAAVVVLGPGTNVQYESHDLHVGLVDDISLGGKTAEQFADKLVSGLSSSISRSSSAKSRFSSEGQNCGSCSNGEELGEVCKEKDHCPGSVNLSRRDSLPEAKFLYSTKTCGKNPSDDNSKSNIATDDCSLDEKKYTFDSAEAKEGKESLMGKYKANGMKIKSKVKQQTMSEIDSVGGGKRAGVLFSESDDSDWAEKLLAKKKKRFKFKKKAACSSSVCTQNYGKKHDLEEENAFSKGRLRLQKTLGDNKDGCNEVNKRANSLGIKDFQQQSQVICPIRKREGRRYRENSDTSKEETVSCIKTKPSEHSIVDVDKENEDRMGSCAKLLERIKSEIPVPDEDTPDVMEVEDLFSDCFILDTLQNNDLTPDERLERQISKLKQLTELDKDQLNYMIGKNEGYLKEIFQGKRACHRHEVYKNGGKGRVDLTYQVQLSVVTEVQQDIVMEKLISIFCKRHHKYLDYILKVMLPEILVKVYMDMNHTTHKETEAKFWECLGLGPAVQ